MKRNRKTKVEVSYVGDYHGCGGSRKLLETNKELTHTHTHIQKTKIECRSYE